MRLLRSRPYELLARSFSHPSASLLWDGPPSALHALYGAAASEGRRFAARRLSGRGSLARLLLPRPAYRTRPLQPAGEPRFFHHQSSNITVGVILGVDLLPTADGLWYLESNLNPAMWPARTGLYEKNDPFVVNLCRFAQERADRRLVIVLPLHQGVDRIMAGRYEKEAAGRKIRLTLLEDAYRRRSRYDQTYRVPELLGTDTLVVRIKKRYQTNLDEVFHSKRGSHRALRIYQERSA